MAVNSDGASNCTVLFHRGLHECDVALHGLLSLAFGCVQREHTCTQRFSTVGPTILWRASPRGNANGPLKPAREGKACSLQFKAREPRRARAARGGQSRVRTIGESRRALQKR